MVTPIYIYIKAYLNPERDRMCSTMHCDDGCTVPENTINTYSVR